MARLLLIFVALFIVHHCEAKPSGGKGRHRNRFSDNEIQRIKNRCKVDPTLCKGETEEHKKKRQSVKNAILNSLKARGKSHGDAEKEAEERLQKIHELKVLIHQEMGISEHVEPADDGLYSGDMLLSTELAQRLIDNRQDTGSMSKRAAAKFLETNPSYKWPSFPIHYWINKTAFSNDEMATIRNGIAALANSTKCLSFVEDAAPATGNQIQYSTDNTNPGGCWTDIPHGGPSSPTQSNLGEDCVYKNIVMHETIHALGGGHEHQRSDRDDYVIYLKDNVDPKYLYAFDMYTAEDGWTSYGVPYRITSIMQYPSDAFTRQYRPLLPTLLNKDKNATIAYPEVLTPEDIPQLNRMYCVTCKDSNPYCGDDAIAGECSLIDSKSRCPKSCGTCDV